MTVFERIRVLFDETLLVYDPATFGGTIYTIFVIFSAYIFVSEREKHSRIKDNLVTPSLIMSLIVINPIILHYALKLAWPNRLVRLFWAFPFEFVIVYCLTEAVGHFKQAWKKAFIIIVAFIILFWGADGRILNHLSIAQNPYKVPDFTIELTELIKGEEDEPSPVVAAPIDILMWFRQYDSDICIAFQRLGDSEFREAMDKKPIDLDSIGKKYARKFDCDFFVLDNTRTSTGSLEDYGYIQIGTVDDRFDVYKYIG